MKSKAIKIIAYFAALLVIMASYNACQSPTAISGASGTSAPGPAGPLALPLGNAVLGVTFAGHLSGKTMYRLPGNVNPSNCWMDSAFWSGTELFYAISSINWTALNQGSLVYSNNCFPQPPFVAQSVPGTTGNFNLYRAKISGSSWVLSNLPLNSGQTSSLAAPKLSGSTLVFVKYEKTSAYGNIYLAQRTGDNTYSAATPFSLNSANCNEDNPMIFANGTKIIFESNRSNPNATSCGTTQKLWSSSFNGSTWSAPIAMSGAPATATTSVTQPWLDTTLTNLYWTGSGGDCAGGVTTCVKTTTGSGSAWAATSTQIITPTAVGNSWAGGGMLGLVGQYTEANGYAFVACGIVADVDPAGSTTGLIFGRYRIDFQVCAIPL